MASTNGEAGTLPEGVMSLLDTDLYKLTMQCAVLKYFSEVEVEYNFTNRTQDMKLNRAAFRWLQTQTDKLANIILSDEELDYLRNTCTYFNEAYLRYMSTFRFRPGEHIHLAFHAINDTNSDEDLGDIELQTKGLWVETILYEIPLLALTSEAYFKFCDRDWRYEGQTQEAYHKGLQLLQNGCLFSEFGSRRRRDYYTQELVLRGLMQAQREGSANGLKGKFTGTSNVHFAMKYGIPPVGTVAHEWFMGVAAITNDYENASETALRYWLATFGKGVLGIALTDTFGTPVFLKAFRKPIPSYTSAESGQAATLPSVAAASTLPSTGSLSTTEPPLHAPVDYPHDVDGNRELSYAQVFTGVRQDSGDPVGFVKVMRDFYDSEGIKDKKTIVFSDSLNVELCLQYKRAAEQAGFQPSFGVGTFLTTDTCCCTDDFVRESTGKKSIPLNIVIKISKAAGRPAVKISDNIGKNTGDSATVAEVKRRLGYTEKEWEGGNERTRWGAEGDAAQTQQA
ncbi:nicotinate phosphoribosyltransferase [Cryomyces antarcticus]